MSKSVPVGQGNGFIMHMVSAEDFQTLYYTRFADFPPPNRPTPRKLIPILEKFLSLKKFIPQDNSAIEYFIPRIIHTYDNSSLGYFICRITLPQDNSSPGLFIPRIILHPLDNSSLGKLPQDNSVKNIPSLFILECGSLAQCGPCEFSLTQFHILLPEPYNFFQITSAVRNHMYNVHKVANISC